MKKVNFLALARKAAEIADDKKGEDVIIINVRKHTAVADYLVIASANSTPQISAITDTIVRSFREEGMHPLHRDGIGSPAWAVVDYGGLVVHVLTPSMRKHYALEEMWMDAKKVK